MPHALGVGGVCGCVLKGIAKSVHSLAVRFEQMRGALSNCSGNRGCTCILQKDGWNRKLWVLLRRKKGINPQNLQTRQSCKFSSAQILHKFSSAQILVCANSWSKTGDVLDSHSELVCSMAHNRVPENMHTIVCQKRFQKMFPGTQSCRLQEPRNVLICLVCTGHAQKSQSRQVFRNPCGRHADTSRERCAANALPRQPPRWEKKHCRDVLGSCCQAVLTHGA